MDDVELDHRLGKASATVSHDSTALALDFLLSLPEYGVRRARRRRTVLVGLPVAAALVAAAGSLTAYQLGVPPFQSTEDGITRVYDPVEYTYRDQHGNHSCQLFLEGRDLTPERVEDLRKVARDPATQQAVTDAAQDAATHAGADGEGAMWVAVGTALKERVRSTLPDLPQPSAGDTVRAGQPAYSGYAGTCR